MTNQVVVTAQMFVKPGHRDQLLDALRQVMPPVQAEDGCIAFTLHEAPDGVLWFVEKWASREQLDAHIAGTASVAFQEAVRPHMDENPFWILAPLLTDLGPKAVL